MSNDRTITNDKPQRATYLNRTPPSGARSLPAIARRVAPARVAVVGAGGIGSYFAARAALAGSEVTLCLRRPQEEFVIRTGGQELRPPVRTVTNPAELYEVDWVFLAVKAHQTPGAANWLAALDRPAAPTPPTVVIMQNGVRLPRRLQGLWSGPAMPAVVFCGAEVLSPGIIEHRSYGFVHVQQGPEADRLAAVFGPEQQEVKPVPDVVRAGWDKLVSNAAVNSITALTCRRLEVLGEPAVGQLARAVMVECAEVARADGAPLDDNVADTVLARVRQLPPEQGSSMLYDRLRGTEMEHQSLIGAVVDIGADYGIATPASSALLALLQAVSGRPLP